MPVLTARRLLVALLGCAYLALLVAPLGLLIHGRQLRESVATFVAAEDRWSAYRTQIEHGELLTLLHRAALGDETVTVDDVTEAVDILYSRNDGLKNNRDNPYFLSFEGYLGTLDAIDAAIAQADELLPKEPGPALRPETAQVLLASVQAVAAPLSALQREVQAFTVVNNDMLRVQIASQSRLEIAAILALIIATVATVGGLVWNNRRLAKLTALAQESEARLRGFMENAPTTMAVKDLDGRYRLVNQRMEEVYDRPAAEMIGRTEAEILGEAANARIAAIERQAIGADCSASAEVRQRRDGVDTWSAEVRFPIRDAAGRTTGLGAIGLDITEQKRTEIALIAATQRAEAANRAKSDFLANMSHELRTPLNAIIGFADIVANETFGTHSNPKYREYAQDIVRSGHHLLDLVADILDLSRVEAGQYPLQEARCHPKNVVDSAIFFVQERAQMRQLQLSVEVEPDLPDMLADRRALLQVLVNLLTNAVKFTPEGGRVRLTVGRSPEGEIVFVVADTGVGIAAVDLPRVLEPFGQVDDPYIQRRDGAGLGLPIARGLVQKHGGTLTIESTPGVGTTVTVTLPAERVLQPEPAEAH